MKKSIYLFIVFITCSLCYAQDIHWSQPSNALLYLNPAFTGIDSRYNVGLNFRDQWNVAGKTYRTYMVAADCRLKSIGIGGLVNSDLSADGRYKTTSAGITLSGLVKVNKHARFGLGAGASFMQNSLSADIFKWGSQFNGESYDPSMASGEARTAAANHFLDLNAGVSFIYDEDQSSMFTNRQRKLMVGYSINHITRPDLALTGGTDKLLMKHTGYLKALLPVKDNLSIAPVILVHYQGVLMEATGGVLARYTRGQTSRVTGNRKGSAFSVGAMYRLRDAIIPTVELEKGNSIFAFSYDINVSSFSRVSKFRGGFELSIRLKATKDLPADKKRPAKKKKGRRWF